MHYNKSLAARSSTISEDTRLRMVDALNKIHNDPPETTLEISKEMLTDILFEFGMLQRSIKQLMTDIKKHELVCKEN